MAYIAKTNGGNTIIEIKTGSLSDILEEDRSNWRLVIPSQTNFDSFSQVKTTSYFTVSEDGSVVNMNWNIENIPDALLKTKLKDYAASVRWQKQEGGITLENGTRILTDKDSQSKIHQVYSILKDGWTETINFKTPNGWVELDLASCTSIARAVFNHIQKCFNCNKEIEQAIDSGGITTKTQIDNWDW